MTSNAFQRVSLVVLACLGAGLAACSQGQSEAGKDADVIIVGAGLAGLSAAVEMGRSGIQVLVVDLNSVAGGTAVRAGGVAMVATPVQERAGIQDSPDQATRDWIAWTEDGDAEWISYYAQNSRKMIYDWVTDMGAEFVRVVPSHGNSVPRFHFTEGRAVHLVLPLFRTALRLPNVSFLWNTRAENLLIEDKRVSGVEVKNLRTGELRTLRTSHVVLATGGFESDLDRVLANWTPDLPLPDHLMIGSSVNATGSGHDMASDAGAALSRIDRHYIYINGAPDPRDPKGKRVLTVGNDDSMWVNAKGQRFTNETGFDKDILVDLLQQKPSSYWMIFDHTTRGEFGMRGAAWLKNSTPAHPLLDNPQVTKKAGSLQELAAMSGLPAEALTRSVQRFNAMVEAGEDTDFGRFSGGDNVPSTIEKAPFYALQMFPMTRKNMGGVAVDKQTRALDRQGQVIPGLYAVGELTGSVGINGKHGLDGMFLGPAILTGRLAGRSIAAAYTREQEALLTEVDPPLPQQDAGDWEAALTAADLQLLLAISRDGYWHFEESHQLVLDRNYQCSWCHSARLPFSGVSDRASRLLQTEVCTTCH
jgi:flavocytochrome c